MSELPIWRLLDWDTNFFGVKTARLLPTQLKASDLEQTLNACRAHDVQVIHSLIASDHDVSVDLLEQAGFHLVDLRVTLESQVRAGSSSSTPANLIVRDYRPHDLAALRTIARASYHHTRYYYDQHYARDRCDALYAEWIARSCQDQAEHVVVAEHGGQAIGYVTCHLLADQRSGQIGLVGVHAETRGLGVGRLLIQAAQQWFFDQGASHVSVVTQGRNIAAQRLYQRCNFVTQQVQLWYHKWLQG